MSSVRPDQDRRVLPRWQASQTAIAALELAATGTAPREPMPDDDFLARKIEWENERSLDVAAELVGTAIVLGRTDEVVAAARQILDAYSEASPTLRELAESALGISRDVPKKIPEQRRGRIEKAAIYREISRLRHRLHEQPRNVLSWVDLGRLYGILGQPRQAERALTTALTLAPNDRFTLRCAARFYCHIGDPRRALAILQAARATKSDPWLMAAEIAVSQLVQRPSKALSTALKISGNGDWSAKSQSEMQGSVATSLLKDGSNGKAKRMFQQSLTDPTENVVAQAQWAVSRTTGLVIPTQALQVPDNFEATALRAMDNGLWSGLLDTCWNWADYEPTSSRPMVMGSYAASVVFGDAKASLEFAERGVTTEPNNAVLLNNKVVALAMLGRMGEAQSIFEKIVLDKASAEDRSVLIATGGMLLFRTGHVEEGRKLYEQVIAHSSGGGHKLIAALALWHLAQEEYAAETGLANMAAARADEASKGMTDHSVVAIGQRVKKAVGS